jgi:hypothetical protein
VTRELLAALMLFGACACDKAPGSNGEPRREVPQQVASAVKDPHAEHDCSQAHPNAPRPAPVTATALSDAARDSVTTLRVSAHQGVVTVRKGEHGWATRGPAGCPVAPERIEQALNNLSALVAERTDEQPTEFELQLAVLSGEERVLHFDVAGRSEGTDLVQLNDGSRFRIRGLDRGLWVPDKAAWCASGP